MLIVDDNMKQKLDELGIQYGEYIGPDDIFLSFVLNVAMETAIKYNDGDPTDQDTVRQYVNYLKTSPVISKCVNRLDKVSHDMLNMIVEETENKHEQIINTKYEEPTE